MNPTRVAPRLLIAGLAGDSGKTVVALATLVALRRRGVPLCAFKKGPDYIDTAWLGWACAPVPGADQPASGQPARNLDSYLMGFDGVAASFTGHATASGVNLIEGNRGLFDGFDAAGTHSTAELAKCLRAPVVIVLNATKMTRTAAALILGCQHFDPELDLAGVILNRVNGKRHEQILRASIEQYCGIPVLGAVPHLAPDTLVPGRHLGLVTPAEHQQSAELECQLLKNICGNLDIDRLLEIATGAPELPVATIPQPALPDGSGLRIGVIRDSSFSFYYAENLEMLEQSGARLVPISALTATSVPADIDALYIGGGFPETHAERLSANTGFLNSLRAAAANGLPIYAECGGLMLLSRAIHWRGSKYPMAAVLPFAVEVCETPQGHGYAELAVDAPNPYFAVGTRLRAHEFHYSRVVLIAAPSAGSAADLAAGIETACAVVRGTGCWQRRDGIVFRNVWASYAHLHALATPEWAAGLLRAARAHAESSQRRPGAV